MNRILLWMIPFAAASTTLIASYAAPNDIASAKAPQFGTKPYGSHLEPILKTVNASTEQREKITAIVAEFRPKISPMLIKYRLKRDQFLQAMITGKSSEDIMSKQEEMNQISSFITNQYCLMNLKVRGLLKPEQIDSYELYRKNQGWVK